MRVGIATGLVVVGELVGAGEVQERRRRRDAEPRGAAAIGRGAEYRGYLLNDAPSRRRTLFEYEAIAPAALKGFQDPVSAWRVVRERTIASRFESLRAASRMPLIGREEEMDLLLRRWRQIKAAKAAWCCFPASPASANRG